MDRKEYQKRWREANPDYAKQWREKNAGYDKQYREENKDKYRESQKRWRKNNPDAVKRHQQAYKGNNKVTKKRRAGERKKMLQAIKVFYGCLNPGCQWQGELKPCCIDYHHVAGEKKFSLGSNVGGIGGQSTIDEVRKCTLLCAICHRLVTWDGLDDSNFPICKVDDEGKALPLH